MQFNFRRDSYRFSTTYRQVMAKKNGSYGISPAAPATSRLRKGYIFYPETNSLYVPKMVAINYTAG